MMTKNADKKREGEYGETNGGWTHCGEAISSVFTKNYEGQEYVMNSYISGRCMKNVIITYWDKEHTDHCKTYTNYVKW